MKHSRIPIRKLLLVVAFLLLIAMWLSFDSAPVSNESQVISSLSEPDAVSASNAETTSDTDSNATTSGQVTVEVSTSTSIVSLEAEQESEVERSTAAVGVPPDVSEEVVESEPVPYELNPPLEPLVLEDRLDCLSREVRRLYANPDLCFREFDMQEIN
jgi:hypothetical protein